MAINSLQTCDQIQPKPLATMNSPNRSNVVPGCCVMKFDIGAEESLSASMKCNKLKRFKDLRSPYLAGDRVQVLSRVTEKRLVHKRTANFVSSFPLAANIYKANSDEFKIAKKSNKKIKKSVLTLPNDPDDMPQSCTVSDMNEYCNRSSEKTKVKAKKRNPVQNNRKSFGKTKGFEFYDRDARICSQLNINLDCSSTDMMKHFNGDGKRTSTKRARKSLNSKEFKPHDVWAVLRNINRFQFKPSPPMSEDSIITPKARKGFVKRRNNRNDTRVIETCREEFAYITSFVDDNGTSISFSPSSSLDRITVIDKENDTDRLSKEFGKASVGSYNCMMKRNNIKKDRYQFKAKTPNRKVKNHNNDVFEIYDDAVEDSQYKGKATILNENNTEFNGPYAITKDSLSTDSKRSSLISNKKSNSYNSSKRLMPRDLNRSMRCFADTTTDTSTDELRSNRCDSVNQPIASLEYTGSSKAAVKNLLNTKEKDSSDDSEHQVKGITKVVLSKGQEIMVSQRLDSQKRKPRLVTTMPSSNAMPKLTQVEIKRKLAQMKFPLVILGKDELSSTMKVWDYEYSQFNGLEEHIWPFMAKWQESEKNQEKMKTDLKPLYRQKSKRHLWASNNLRKVNNDMDLNRKPDNTLVNNDTDLANNKKKLTQKKILSSADTSSVISQKCKKQKSVRKFKEKMLQLLYKKPSNSNMQVRKVESKVNNVRKTQVDVGTETCLKLHNASKDYLEKAIDTNPIMKKRLNMAKYPWAKAKWASDFIDNVIKKIKRGVYYTQELKPTISHSKDIGVQTSSVAKKVTEKEDHGKDYDNIDITQKIIGQTLRNIPGFDNALPDLEIKTLSVNQIAIKHCVTNVMVQFDVSIPVNTDNEALDVRESSSFIPIAVTESHTKIFKCKTTIVNAMLPAELCTILPAMINNIINSDMKDAEKLSIFPVPVVKTESHLSTISELTQCESVSPLYPTLPYNSLSPQIRRLLEGMFADLTLKKVRVMNGRKLCHRTPRITSNEVEMERFLPNLSSLSIFYCEELPVTCIMSLSCRGEKLLSNHLPDNSHQKVVYTALEPYNASKRQIIPVFERYNFENFMEKIKACNYLSFVVTTAISVCTKSINLTMNINNICLGKMIVNNPIIDKNNSLSITELTVDSLYKALPNPNSFREKSAAHPRNVLDYTSNVNNLESASHVCGRHNQNSTSGKPRKRSFIRLYKKCKSTSNITGEKHYTSLNKINNIDDFLQVIGSGKILSAVFDNFVEKKVLSCLIEMKNWIREISPRQAMLILLLMNKKDTPNLMKFRPILLQGIAVNRITRATELDMEIEVIEREHFHKLSQFEGISYVPASIENQDNLIEELYWIAKTTASDYQRPFDESSERLLKSLLEKRKKLNPSYLRVMARYVGLGLLKSPKKNY